MIDHKQAVVRFLSVLAALQDEGGSEENPSDAGRAD
jgi:hypothetical protein